MTQLALLAWPAPPRLKEAPHCFDCDLCGKPGVYGCGLYDDGFAVACKAHVPDLLAFLGVDSA